MMSSPFLTDINSIVGFMFNFISFQVAYPKQLLLQPQIEGFTFHLGGNGSHGIFSRSKALGISSSLFGLATKRWLNTRSEGMIMGWRAAMSGCIKCIKM